MNLDSYLVNLLGMRTCASLINSPNTNKNIYTISYHVYVYKVDVTGGYGDY